MTDHRKGRGAHRTVLAGIFSLVLALAATGCAGQQTPHGAAPGTAAENEQELYESAIDAYLYGYPLVTMELTRRVMTNVEAPDVHRAPMGRFANMREYPTAAFRDFTTPNADTLYSIAWLDLAKEPYVLSLPDMRGRYFLMPMMSGWTDVFASPGTRTTGTKAQVFAVTGPGFKGALPAGVTEIKAPTSMVWILGRTYCDGTPEDYQAVHALQDAYSLVPLSAYGRPYAPPKAAVDSGLDMKTPVRDQVNALDTEAFFNLLAQLMADNPPAREDAPMAARMARLGIAPGQPFRLAAFSPELRARLADVPREAFRRIVAYANNGKDLVNGWQVRTNLGRYGTQYMLRAMVTVFGVGANLPQDSVYPAYVAPGKKLSGSGKYVIRFEKGMLPPVEGFWSLTMYDKDFFFVDNPLNRYTISSRNRLKTGPDGSIELYLQRDNPGKDKEANWLPGPEGQMNPIFRLYWPKTAPPSILDGSWSPPAIIQVQ